jgi:hypothetical protein
MLKTRAEWQRKLEVMPSATTFRQIYQSKPFIGKIISLDRKGGPLWRFIFIHWNFPRLLERNGDHICPLGLNSESQMHFLMDCEGLLQIRQKYPVIVRQNSNTTLVEFLLDSSTPLEVVNSFLTEAIFSRKASIES